MTVANRDRQQRRAMAAELTTRAADEGDEMVIEGYFAVYGQETELWPGAFEELAPGAFDGTLGNDIRALVNHDTTLVLGRNRASTLELKADAQGLWGRIKVNLADSDAVNVYERVKRGDVDQCSFGFNILAEETDWRDDGTVKWTITKIDLHEVSVVTFPAYEQTGVQARKAQVHAHRERELQARKQQLKARVKKDA